MNFETNDIPAMETESVMCKLKVSAKLDTPEQYNRIFEAIYKLQREIYELKNQIEVLKNKDENNNNQ